METDSAFSFMKLDSAVKDGINIGKRMQLFDEKEERLDTVNDDIRLIQKKNGLTFGTDALLLASYIQEKPDALAMEFGGGSGIISLLVLTRKKAKAVTIAEIQPSFAKLCERNATLNALSDQVTVLCADIRALSPDEDDGSYQFVFTNPPYMANAGIVNQTEEKAIARHELSGGIADFCAAASKKLKYGGNFYCVFRPERLTDLLDAMRKNGIEPKMMTMVHPSFSMPPCLVLVKGKRGGKPSMVCTKPLFLYADDTHGQNSEAYDAILEKGNFPADFFA